MPATYEILKPAEAQARSREQFALDVLIGLTEMPKRLPSKYFYDTQGSRLFRAIMELPEYYLTRCEAEILQQYRNQIAGFLGKTPFNLIELGPGDARKTRLLLEHFLELRLNFKYIPIDISESAMQELVESLSSEFSRLEVSGVVSDYFQALNWIRQFDSRKNLVLFLGSNIGNFNARASRVFLRSLWNTLNDQDLLLVGFDLKKDMDYFLRAYNDSQGITSEFNYNLLRRINRELGGDFDPDKFKHFGTYNVFSGAMESYLVSMENQSVNVKAIGQSFHFEAWEPIHTEYSYKYLESDISKLAEETGFSVEENFYDSNHYFTDCIWSVRKLKA